MSKRVRIGFGVLLVLALVVVLFGVLRPREPVYNGKPLRYWLELSIATGPPTPERMNDVEAVRQIGANAVPTLLAMVRANDSRLKLWWIKWVRSHSRFHIRVRTEVEYHNMACFGFYSLGSAGKGAVPDLMKLLKEKKWQTRVLAADCLGDIGPDASAAVPDLVRFLNDPERLARWEVTINLGRIHARPDLAVPALIASLSPTNTFAPTTIDALRAYGPDARSAVPILLTYLNNQDQGTRDAAMKAIKAIDPGAVAKGAVR